MGGEHLSILPADFTNTLTRYAPLSCRQQYGFEAASPTQPPPWRAKCYLRLCNQRQSFREFSTVYTLTKFFFDRYSSCRRHTLKLLSLREAGAANLYNLTRCAGVTIIPMIFLIFLVFALSRAFAAKHICSCVEP